MSLEEIEKALDSRQLFGQMINGAWWRLRRNGKTKRWVRDANRFRIPIKAGFRTYGEITETSDMSYFRIGEQA